MYDLLIKNGTILDGTGGDSYIGDVAVKDGLICGVGRVPPTESLQTVDASGKYIVPGFINSHSHCDLTAALCPDLESLTVQGVTTVCTGHCGMSIAPIPQYYMGVGSDEEAMGLLVPPLFAGSSPQTDAAVVRTDLARRAYAQAYGVSLDWSSWAEFTNHLRRTGVGPNLMGLVGHACIRIQVLGPDFRKTASEEEIHQMCQLLRRCMEEGANGLSLGLDYVPGNYADEAELLALAATVAEYDGILSAHVQHSGLRAGRWDPTFQPYQGFREFLELGRKTGVRLQISHLRPAFRPIADQNAARAASKAVLDLIQEYRQMGVCVNWDVLPNYPEAGRFRPMLASRLEAYVAQCGGLLRFQACLQDPEYLRRLRSELVSGHNPGQNNSWGFHISTPDWDAMLEICRCEQSAYLGKTIRELAAERALEPIDLMLQLLKEDPRTCVQLRYLRKDYLGFDYYIAHPEASVGLDDFGCNYACDLEIRPDMPPVYRGAYSDFAGMPYLLSMDTGMEKTALIAAMTGRTAENLGLRDRGLLRCGMHADIVVLDWEHLDPNIDYVHPNRPPKGIDYVWINGVLTAEKGVAHNPRAGKIICNSHRRHGQISR